VNQGKLFLWVFLLFWVIGRTLAAQASGDFQKGLSYYKQGQYEKAVAEFERIVASSPDYEAGYRVLGDAYLQLKRYEDAAKAFHRAAQLDGSKFVSFYGAAVAEFNLKQYRACVQTLTAGEKAASAPRERYQLHHLRGAAYYNMGDFAAAARDLREAVAIQGTNYEDLFQLGVSYFRLGRHAEARQALQRAAAIRPDDREAKRFLARVQYAEAIQAIQDRKFAEAERELREVVAALPDDAAAWYNLGLAQLFQEQWTEAESSFRRSLQLNSERWEVFERLAFVQERLGRYEESLRSYRRALELNPAEARLQENVKRVEERIRRRREGLEEPS
jgi:tetratricopeptide (TPR) repeat protein